MKDRKFIYKQEGFEIETTLKEYKEYKEYIKKEEEKYWKREKDIIENYKGNMTTIDFRTGYYRTQFIDWLAYKEEDNEL